MKRKILTLTALMLSIMLILPSCAVNSPENSGESTTLASGGSDIADESNSETEKVTRSETENATQATTGKYSPKDKLIALTFDDGPRESTTNRILDLLEANGSVATFFIVGTNIENNVETINRAKNMGCEIANHSYSHKNLTKCSSSEIREQVDKPNELLRTLTGIVPRLFRAPGGNYGGVEDEIGMPVIQWSIDTNDWRYKDAAHKGRSEAQRNSDLNRIAQDVIDSAEEGDIVLMHDIYDFTADLCEILIPALIEKGFKLVTVSEMYDAYGAELKAGKVYRCVDVIPADTEPLAAGSYFIKTNGGRLNVREEADSSSESLAKAMNGDAIIVLRAIPGWAYVDYNGVNGWVNAAYLEKAE